MKTILSKKKNIFIYGLTGSGKDTLLNIIKENDYNYVYLRLADTLKHIVTESLQQSYHELEISKRGSDELRKLHNDIDINLRQYMQYPDESIGTNRARLIIKRRTWEFTNPPILSKEIKKALKKYPILISDVREQKVIELLLEAGYHGIFIDRLFENKEYKNEEHLTEFNFFKDFEFRNKILNKHSKQITLITDETHKFLDSDKEYKNPKNHFTLDVEYDTKDTLYMEVKGLFNRVIKTLKNK